MPATNTTPDPLGLERRTAVAEAERAADAEADAFLNRRFDQIAREKKIRASMTEDEWADRVLGRIFDASDEAAAERANLTADENADRVLSNLPLSNTD